MCTRRVIILYLFVWPWIQYTYSVLRMVLKVRWSLYFWWEFDFNTSIKPSSCRHMRTSVPMLVASEGLGSWVGRTPQLHYGHHGTRWPLAKAERLFAAVGIHNWIKINELRILPRFGMGSLDRIALSNGHRRWKVKIARWNEFKFWEFHQSFQFRNWLQYV